MKEEFNSVYNACMDAIVAYLSTNEGSIDHLPLSYIEECKDGLSSNDVLTIGSDGLYVFTMTDPPASDLERWLCGIVCGIVAIVSLAAIIALPGAGIGIGSAVIAAIAGGSLGAAAELFSQVTVNGTSLANVDWSHVLVAMAVGIATGPFLGEISGIVAGSIGAGVEAAACCLIDGESISTALLAGAMGLAAGAAFGAGALGLKQVVKVLPHKAVSSDKIDLGSKKLRRSSDNTPMTEYEMEKQKKVKAAEEENATHGYVRSKVLPELLIDIEETPEMIVDSVFDPKVKKYLTYELSRDHSEVGNRLASDYYRNYEKIPQEKRYLDHEQKVKDSIIHIDKLINRLEGDYTAVRYIDKDAATKILSDIGILKMLKRDAYFALHPDLDRVDW